MMKVVSRIKAYILAHRLPAYIVSAIIIVAVVMYLWSAHYSIYHRYDKVPDLIGLDVPEHMIWTCYTERDTEVGDKFADVSDVRLKLWFDEDSSYVTQQVTNKGWSWSDEDKCYVFKRNIYDIRRIGEMVATWDPDECIIHYSCVVEMSLPDYIIIYGIMAMILISVCAVAYFTFRISFYAIKWLLRHLP